MSHLRVVSNPEADLKDLGIDDNPDDAYLGETSSQHIPLEMEYNDTEDWYWRYGSLRLYDKFYPHYDKAASQPETWLAMQRFVTDYAWVEGKLRFILDKPCWSLHTDVVDRIVMLYHARKNFEQVRATETGKVQVEFLETLDRITKEIQELLSHCELQFDENGPTPKIPFIHHVAEKRVREWVPSLLHRVLKFEGVPLPHSPVMMVAGKAEQSSLTLLEGGLSTKGEGDAEVAEDGDDSDEGGGDNGDE